MNNKLSLRQRLVNLNEKAGYAKQVVNNLATKGITVKESQVYLVVNGRKRVFADEILLEVEKYVIERERTKAAIQKERERLYES